MSVDLDALEKYAPSGHLTPVELKLIAEVRALRTERDKWMADHSRQYSIAAAYAVERDALRSRVAELEHSVNAWISRCGELERLGNAILVGSDPYEALEAWQKAVRKGRLGNDQG